MPQPQRNGRSAVEHEATGYFVRLLFPERALRRRQGLQMEIHVNRRRG